MNYYAAHRIGLRLRFSLDWSHPGLRDWVRMSIPLMIGVSLVSADTWILNYFASGGHGDIAKLNYAKNSSPRPWQSSARLPARFHAFFCRFDRPGAPS